MKRTSKCWTPILLWAFTIGGAGMLFFFSGQNGAQSSRLSMAVTRFILRILPEIPLDISTLHFYVRKLAHFSIFAAEGALLCAALLTSLHRLRISAWITTAICAIMAALNEYHQSFKLGRSCELRDMLIDFAGALFGLLLAVLLNRCLQRRNVII